MKVLDIPLKNVYAWSDSSITLSWLNTTPYKLKTYVVIKLLILSNEYLHLTGITFRQITTQLMWHLEASHPQTESKTRVVVDWTYLGLSATRKIAYPN